MALIDKIKDVLANKGKPMSRTTISNALESPKPSTLTLALASGVKSGSLLYSGSSYSLPSPPSPKKKKKPKASTKKATPAKAGKQKAKKPASASKKSSKASKVRDLKRLLQQRYGYLVSDLDKLITKTSLIESVLKEESSLRAKLRTNNSPNFPNMDFVPTATFWKGTRIEWLADLASENADLAYGTLLASCLTLAFLFTPA
ncbi:hypothetical protein TrRE_jg1932, partial [Triparma retinervis]